MVGWLSGLSVWAQVVGPIASTYWWKGKVETAPITALPIVAGSREYSGWLGEEVGGCEKDGPPGSSAMRGCLTASIYRYITSSRSV